MFVQVIQGKIGDRDRLWSQLDAWEQDIAPGADGWLGTTAGVTDDGVSVAVVRFESEELAMANSERPEQGAWWDETAGCFEGEPSFSNSLFVDLDTPGDPGAAGFVQVMQGEVTDLDRTRALMKGDSADFEAARPDVLGNLVCGHAEGRWTMVIYFRSEAEARVAEKEEMPEGMAEVMQELENLSVGETTYYDLREPRFSAPG